MKVHPQCFVCGARKTAQRIVLSTKDPKLQMRCAKAFLKLMAEHFKESVCPAHLGTLQIEMVKRITKCKDPFKKIKREERKGVEKAIKFAKGYIAKAKNEDEKFSRACKVSAAANATEFMAPYKEFGIKKFKIGKFSIDHSKEVLERAKSAKRILFLTDNHREALFDKLLLNELRRITNAKIVIGVSKEAFDDDLTFNEAQRFNFGKYGKIINTGNAFGIWWERAPKRILKEIKNADLIIAKGLANYETLTERKVKNVAYFLTVKCESVAKELGVPIGTNVILFKS